MSFLKNIFGKKDEPIKSYADFWKWFQLNEKSFFNAVKDENDIEKNFFSKLSPKLSELKDGYYFLTGMFNDTTVELIFSAEGNFKNIPFVEDLVSSAPVINGWIFTPLKPPLSIENVCIKMAGYEFSSKNLNFYANEDETCPDEIDISVIYKDYIEEDKSIIVNGVSIFLDNFLGELNFATTIDYLTVIGKESAVKELIPIEKLKDYLIWRQKEFIEKYEAVLQNTENDTYSSYEAKLSKNRPLIAIIDSDLLNWDSKASHPWIVTVEMKYDGEKTNGMPDEKTYKLLDEIEENISGELKDAEGYLYIGRQTADNVREIYFACKDFRKPSKLVYEMVLKYSPQLDISYEIYKDKYWRSFNRFMA